MTPIRSRAWMTHLRDRWIIGLTAGRLVIALCLLVIPVLVPVPGTDGLLPVAAFLPLVVAVPAALSLRERLAWLGTGVAARRLGILRMSTSLGADAIVLGACAVVASIAPSSIATASGVWLPSAVACAAAVEGAAYLVAVVSVRFAWLVAATLGGVTLLGLPPNGIPLVFSMPSWAGAAIFVLGFAAHAATSMRRRPDGDD
jgi:hypothetical protein